MPAGDVQVQIVDATTSAIDTAVTAMRTGANDKWMMCSVGLGQVCVVNVEEA